MAVDSDTIQFLDDVKKGKARKFAMICKGVNILGLIVYKKGTEEKHKKEAKKQGKGKFFGGVVTGKGVDIRFQLLGTAYDKLPGKELTLKDFLATEAGFKCKPKYEIVNELEEVDESDEASTTGETNESATIDVSDLERRLNALGAGIKTFVASHPDRRVDILKPTKTVKDYLLDPANQDREAAENALTTIEQLVGTSSSSSVDTTGIAGRLKEFAAAIKQFVAANPQRAPEVLGPTKIVKAFLASPTEEGLRGAETALNQIDETLNGSTDSQSTGGPTARDWAAAAKKLAPTLKEALSTNVGDGSKMRAWLAFAKEKADGGDYEAALKTLTRIEEHITEAREAMVGPEADYRKVAKNAAFQVRRLQFALRGYEKELSNELKNASEQDAQRIEAARVGTLEIANRLDEVFDRFQAEPPTIESGQREKFIDDLTDYLRNDRLVSAAEQPNPFNLKVDLRGPLLEALGKLAPQTTTV